MSVVFPILIGLAMVATLGVLFFGVLGMGRQGEGARERSNKLMQYRVLLQALALALFAVFMLWFRH